MNEKDERLTYKVEELKSLLGIGHNRVYELVHSRDFPAIRIGRRWHIPKDKFKEWLEKETEKAMAGGDGVDYMGR